MRHVACCRARGERQVLTMCLLPDFRVCKVASVPLEGFVNGLAVSSTGTFLVAAVGQEHRLGRWEHLKKARNEVCVVQLPSGGEDEGVTAMDTDSVGEDEQRDVDGEEAD